MFIRKLPVHKLNGPCNAPFKNDFLFQPSRLQGLSPPNRPAKWHASPSNAPPHPPDDARVRYPRRDEAWKAGLQLLLASNVKIAMEIQLLRGILKWSILVILSETMLLNRYTTSSDLASSSRNDGSRCRKAVETCNTMIQKLADPYEAC